MYVAATSYGVPEAQLTNWDRALDFNEPEIGQVFKTTTVPRKELFITTKL
jgi:diketogulonate reductase-like aldo/keto reductase